jgi:hypothetical protein
MDYRKPLLRIAGLFGGEVKPILAGGFTWSIPRDLLSRCLDAVIPFLMVKREQAELLREMWNTFQDTGRKRGQAPSEDVVVYRQKLTDRITSLKDDYSLKPIPILPKKCINAYVAGILDAEGSFGIYYGFGKRYLAKVQVGMCDPTPITVIVKFFGGCMMSSSKNHKNTVYFSALERGAAVNISKKTKPYRLLKQEQSSLVILLQNHIDLWQAKRHGNTPHPEKVISQRERWYQRCRSLNSQSVRAETNPSRPSVASDSPNCIGLQDAEPAEMTGRYATA